MKINNAFKLRDIAGETIVVNQGTADKDMTKIISLNASAKFLFVTLQYAEFSIEDAADVLTKHYGIDSHRAVNDAAAWIEALKKCGIITG